MPEITDKELPQSVKSFWLKALHAIEVKNFGYAVSLLQATARGDDATSPAQLDAAPSVLFIHVYIYKGMRILCYIKYSHE